MENQKPHNVPLCSEAIQYIVFSLLPRQISNYYTFGALLMATQRLWPFCECTVLGRGSFGSDHGKPWTQQCRFIESRRAYERWPSWGLLLWLAPQSGACRPEWVCGCFSICHDVVRPRCFSSSSPFLSFFPTGATVETGLSQNLEQAACTQTTHCSGLL